MNNTKRSAPRSESCHVVSRPRPARRASPEKRAYISKLVMPPAGCPCYSQLHCCCQHNPIMSEVSTVIFTIRGLERIFLRKINMQTNLALFANLYICTNLTRIRPKNLCNKFRECLLTRMPLIKCIRSGSVRSTPIRNVFG